MIAFLEVAIPTLKVVLLLSVLFVAIGAWNILTVEEYETRAGTYPSWWPWRGGR